VNGAGTLTNNGTINESGPNDVILQNGAALSNASGAIFDFTGDSSLIQAGTGGSLASAGTVEKTAGTGTSTISCSFALSGPTLAVNTGTLALDNSGSVVNGCAIAVAPSAALNMTDGQSVTYQGSFTGSGGGTIYLNSGSIVVSSSGVTFNMPAAGATFEWSAGTIDVSSGGTLTNPSGSTFNFNTGGANLPLNGAGSLLNQGTISESGGGATVKVAERPRWLQ